LGLEPHLMSDAVLAEMLRKVRQYDASIDPAKIQPRIAWNKA
jgi:hypothetical protein